MLIYRECPMCGKTQSLEIDAKSFEAWRSGTLIQNAFPTLPVHEREFIKTGYCNDCQEELFAFE